MATAVKVVYGEAFCGVLKSRVTKLINEAQQIFSLIAFENISKTSVKNSVKLAMKIKQAISYSKPSDMK